MFRLVGVGFKPRCLINPFVSQSITITYCSLMGSGGELDSTVVDLLSVSEGVASSVMRLSNCWVAVAIKLSAFWIVFALSVCFIYEL